MGDLKWDVFQAGGGWIGALVSDKGLKRMTLPERTPEDALHLLEPHLDGAERDCDALSWLQRRVLAYFDGEEPDLYDVPVDVPDAPPFFRTAWEACRSIPPGETRSYGWLAAAAGSPGAARAAGQSMARNPVPLAIPCHRVVASDGSLHGFGGCEGLPMKKWLLELEASAAGEK